MTVGELSWENNSMRNDCNARDLRAQFLFARTAERLLSAQLKRASRRDENIARRKNSAISFSKSALLAKTRDEDFFWHRVRFKACVTAVALAAAGGLPGRS
jgi:hypothetical protein